MSPLPPPRPSFAGVLALAGALTGSAALAGCASSDPIGGCWEASRDGSSRVSFFIDTDDDSVLGAETTGEGDDAVRIEFEGRLEASGGDTYGIEATCTSGGCSGVRDWSMRCTLDESGDEPVLQCSGAPFASATDLTTCQGSATVPQ